MALDKIESMWASDCKIDSTDLDRASADTYELHHKYSKILNKAKLEVARLDAEKAKLTLIKRDYYNGRMDKVALDEYGWKPFKLTLMRDDLPAYLAADQDLIDITLRIAELNQIVSYLDSIIRAINNRGFHIRNMLENRKFVNGGY